MTLFHSLKSNPAVFAPVKYRNCSQETFFLSKKSSGCLIDDKDLFSSTERVLYCVRKQQKSSF